MAVVGGLLTSCGAYRKYQPVSSVSDDLFGIDVPISDTTTLASVGWREMFNDPYLQPLIDTALVRNTDYQVAQLRTEQALASLGAARLAYIPTLNIAADGNVAEYDGLTGKTYNIGLNASWEIDIFGKLTAAK